MASDWVLSIDFGTSNTAAAHSAAVSGSIESLALSHASNLMPSGVFVENPDRIAVGDHAVNESQRNPAAFIPSPKRQIGPPTISVNGYSLPTWLPVAAVFRAVISRAGAAHAGELPAHLVLTHPEAWSQPQIQVLIDAAISAGMPAAAISTVSEPRAAVAHYARSASLTAGTKVAVFDFGGGTLDVAVLEKQSDNSFTVLAARGENSLGGKNFDALIRRWVDQQLAARNPELQQFLRREAPIGIRTQLDDSIRRAKELLSDTPSATITVAGGGFHETLQLTRDEFDELITPPLTIARQLTQATLADAGITSPNDLAALYLTGGTSRIPLVHDKLAGLGPVATLDDPKTVVAQGALATWMATNPQPASNQAPFMPDLVGGRAAPTEPLSGSAPPGWSPAEVAPPAQPPTSRRTPLLIGGAIAAAAVVAVAAVVVFTQSGSDDSSSPSAVSSGGPSASPSVTLSYNQDQVLSALPAKLRSDLQNCAQDPYSGSNFNAYSVKCVVRVDSELLTGIADPSTDVTVEAYIDQRSSQRNLVTYKANRNGGVYVQGNSDNTSGAVFENNPDITGPTWSGSYASATSYLSIDAGKFTSSDNAKTFMQRAGLLPS